MSSLTFVMSDELAEASAAAFAEHQRRIDERLPGVEIRHIGGTSIPGLLTTGDVDIPGTEPHVEFALTVVGSLVDLHHGDAWHRIAEDQDLIA